MLFIIEIELISLKNLNYVVEFIKLLCVCIWILKNFLRISLLISRTISRTINEIKIICEYHWINWFCYHSTIHFIWQLVLLIADLNGFFYLRFLSSWLVLVRRCLVITIGCDEYRSVYWKRRDRKQFNNNSNLFMNHSCKIYNSFDLLYLKICEGKKCNSINLK